MKSKHGVTRLWLRSVAVATWTLAMWTWRAAPAAGQPVADVRLQDATVYQSGVQLHLTLEEQLRGGDQEQIIRLPDLWYMDKNTLEVKLAPEAVAAGVTYFVESKPAATAEQIGIYRASRTALDSLLLRHEALLTDSTLLARRIEFLRANTALENASVAQIQAADLYLQKQYEAIYDSQYAIRQEIKRIEPRIERVKQSLERTAEQQDNIFLVRLRVKAPRAMRAKFEVTYSAKAARWGPLYVFRFDPGSATAVLEYQAVIRQWTNFNWRQVPTTLSYSQPWARVYTPRALSPKRVYYYPPQVNYEGERKQERKMGYATMDLASSAVAVTEYGGVYVGEAELTVSQAGQVSYRLPRPLTLAYSTADGQITQTVPLKKEEVPVFYTYEVTPCHNTNVTLMANIPNWQRLYLTSGPVTVYSAGQMLTQTSLETYGQKNDTLTMPLLAEPRITVTRRAVGEYKERASGARVERTASFEITVKNNRAMPIVLTVKDQYPVSTTDQVEVLLVECSGAELTPREGLLTWKLELDSKAERTLRVTYTVKYPKEGSISGY